MFFSNSNFKFVLESRPANGIMLIDISVPGSTSGAEWCLLEFQGEFLGDIAPGVELGEILEIKVKWHRLWFRLASRFHSFRERMLP